MTPTSNKSSPSPAATHSNGNSKTKSGMPYGKDDPKRHQKILISSIGGVALVVAVALLFIFRPWQHTPPKVTGDPSKLSQFVNTDDFHNMSFEKREIYMKMMHAKKDQIVKSYTDGQITVDEYQKDLLMAHLGKNLDDMRKYFAKPVGAERVKYLDKVITKKDEKDEAAKRDPTAKEVANEQSLLKDDTAERAEVATWPQDVQTEYNQYRQALEDRKKLRKDEQEAKNAENTPTTKPAASGA